METGRIIDGRFQIERHLGKGNMSTVWLALDGPRRVAIKFAEAEEGNTLRRAIARLAAEAQVLAKLDHPNVPKLVFANIDAPKPYLVMDYIDGISLEQEVGRRARNTDHFGTDDLIRLIQEIAATLHYAHSFRVVHRDLKPSNVMLLERVGRLYAKVLDFGVAKMLDEDPREATTVGRIVGTPLYLSPEQVFASGRVDVRADVFAMGVLAFEMLALRRAWLRGEDHLPLSSWRPVLKGGRNTKDQVLHRITEGPRPSVCEIRPDLSDKVDRVVAKALSVDPDLRHSTPIDLARDLEKALRMPPMDTTPVRARPTKPMFPPA